MSKCDKCGAEIHWAKLESGARVPLDATAKVYRYDKRDGEMGDAIPAATNIFVSHFAVCSKGAAKTPVEQRTGQVTAGDADRATAFCLRLHAAGLELDDFEQSFVASVVERSEKYKGNVRYTDRQLGVVDKLREKYEDRLPREGDEPPPQEQHAKLPPRSPQPVGVGQESDNIPF